MAQQILDFQRYGNAYAAEINGTIYVVSLYCGSWVAHYRTAEMAKPLSVGREAGYSNPVDAMHACQESRNLTPKGAKR